MKSSKKSNWFEKLFMMGEDSQEDSKTNRRKKAGTTKKSKKNAKGKKKSGQRRFANHDNAPFADESYAQVPPIDDCSFDDTAFASSAQNSDPVSVNWGGKKSEVSSGKETGKNRSEFLPDGTPSSSGDKKQKTMHKRTSAGGALSREPKYTSGNCAAHPALRYICLAAGLFLTVSFLLSFFMSKGQFNWTAETHPFRWVGYHLERFLFGVLGHGAFLLPVAMIYIPISCFVNRRAHSLPLKWILAGIIIALFSAIVHACMLRSALCRLTWNLAELYKTGAVKASGGILGGYLGRLSYHGFGPIGTIAIGSTGILLAGIFILGTTPAGVWQWLRAKNEENRARREERRAQREEIIRSEAEKSSKESTVGKKDNALKMKQTAAPARNEASDATFTPINALRSASAERKKDVTAQQKDTAVAATPKKGEKTTSVDLSAIKPFSPREVEEIFASIAGDDKYDGNGNGNRTFEEVRQGDPAALRAEEERYAREQEEKAKAEVKENADDSDKNPSPSAVPEISFRNEETDAGLKEELTSYPTHAEFTSRGIQTTVDKPKPESVKSSAADVVIPLEFDKEEPLSVEEKAPVSDGQKLTTTFSKAENYAGGFDYSAEGTEGEDIDEAENERANTAPVVKEQNGVGIRIQPLTEKEREKGNVIVTDAQLRKEEVQMKKSYVYPAIDLLDIEKQRKETIEEKVQAKMRLLSNTLASFKVRIDNISYVYGPTVTRYEVRPAPGIRVRSITALADDIAMALAAPSIRIEAPIAGMNAVGIEVPNDERETVSLRGLIESDDFRNRKSKLTCALGKDVAGTPIFFDIYKMPHLLIAGTTGSGKSVCINSIVMSLLYKSTPDEVKLIMIDPKTVEFSVYKDIPHLLAPIVCDSKRAAAALNLAVQEMEDRYNKIREVGVRDIGSYNSITANDRYEHPYMPHIVIIIDELADLMMTARDEVEKSIGRLSQKARAAGMHLIIGTQRPSVDVITGVIKANVPSRIAFTVVAQVDSRTILDISGAEKLIGMGDMLYAPVGSPKPLRVQGSFVSDEEVQRVVDFIKRKNEPVKYNQDFINNLDREAEMIGNKHSSDERDTSDDVVSSDGLDTKFYEALRVAVENKRISTSLLQRTLSIGYGRAAKIIDEMEKRGFIGPAVGNKPREILIDHEGYMEVLAKRDD